MLFWTLQITVISIILIFLVHNLFGFFKSTLTVPKIKDLVDGPVHKYENIYNTINSSSKTNLSNDTSENAPSDYDKKSMKNELKQFLKNKLNNADTDDNDNDNTTSISSLDYGSANSLQYSEI